MKPDSDNGGACGTSDHFSRRTLLRAAGCSGLAWLTPLGKILAREAEQQPWKPARSVILLWMAGGPSQLETFDPHPGKAIAYGSKAIPTRVNGVQIGAGLEQTATVMDRIALIRSVTSKEGDHERATYNVKTGYRPVPAIIHPSIGSVICHELGDGGVEIPTHISLLPSQWPARGGYLGASYDAFQVGDPSQPVPDVRASAEGDRQKARFEGLSVIERSFLKGRSLDQKLPESDLHRETQQKALRMMSSEQLKAFDVGSAPAAERLAFGDTPFGRACFAAVRLVEAGVRCIEVTLGTWDSHLNNHETHAERIRTLDPALAALITTLERRGLLDQTVVMCGGEFGRTPTMNAVEGRDHWPHGFSVALAGGGIRGGCVLGETDPSGEKKRPTDPVTIGDLHTTIQYSLGLDPDKKIMTPVGRPMKLSEGLILDRILA